ncbi:cyclin-domain-containing protein [Durotheca rogersii]|uniref:cyclin-domain-containing protein n=1 Tax=Durotheca rogersii TaxID=419775 RepID=UPI00221F3433|nr:cyclin-domain-containing protein [Durotheca rogersii]KAI5859629.1 cyclin-domain-containing protein [Durotheca rogersii]
MGDLVTDHPRLHNLIATSGLPHDHNRPREPSFRSESRNRPRETPSQRVYSPAVSASYRPSASSATPSKRSWEATETGKEERHISSTGGASRFPTPPESSSPNSASVRSKTQNATCPSSEYMASETQSTAAAVTSFTPTPTRQQPSPDSDSYGSPPPRAQPDDAAASPQGKTIYVRDLAHIQSLARADLMNGGNGPGILNDTPLQAMKYEISGMPIGDIIEMVAALLTKITTTNDLQHDALHRNVTHQQTAASHSCDGASMSPLSSSVLAFHGKNVPAITILSYLSRIHKYCPTTYEVFLSLLVYFDRMTERVNNMVMEAESARRQSKLHEAQKSQLAMVESKSGRNADNGIRGEDGRDDEAESELVDDDDDEEEEEREKASKAEKRMVASPSPSFSAPATYFVVDSFNIHRLIIAGVTCASKFFSDVFYTNSRYAKVGGLPLAELNHLELQFLLLNDFRLAVPVEDLEAYATMLVEFYAREVIAQRSRRASGAE